MGSALYEILDLFHWASWWLIWKLYIPVVINMFLEKQKVIQLYSLQSSSWPVLHERIFTFSSMVDPRTPSTILSYSNSLPTFCYQNSKTKPIKREHKKKKKNSFCMGFLGAIWCWNPKNQLIKHHIPSTWNQACVVTPRGLAWWLGSCVRGNITLKISSSNPSRYK
jgi:hypothetical protein